MLCHIVASSVDSKISGIFHDAQLAIPVIYVLTQMRQPQPSTPLQTDNATAKSFFHDNINQNKSKS